MKGRFFLVVALTMVGVPKVAAKHPRVSVPNAAPSLEAFGFTLGQTPTLLTCPTTRDGSFDSRSWSAEMDATCLELANREQISADGRSKTTPVHFNHSDEIRMVSSSGAGTFELQRLDGKLQGILGRTSGADSQSRVYAVLRKKYGVPVTLIKKRVPGTQVDGLHAAWTFSNLRVNFDGIGATPREGSFSIITDAAFDHAKLVPLASGV